MENSSTATTCSPAPMAKSISVPVEDSDTMLSGIVSMVTAPLASVTSTGNPASVADVVGSGAVGVVGSDVAVVVATSPVVVVIPPSAAQATNASRVRIRVILRI